MNAQRSNRRGWAMATSGDEGSGSLLAVAIAAAILATTAIVLPLYIGMTTRQAVIGAADAAALAAADVAAGIVPGYPCDVARTVAQANHAELAGCDVDGPVATVRTSSSFLGVSLTASARAGPPDWVSN